MRGRSRRTKKEHARKIDHPSTAQFATFQPLARDRATLNLGGLVDHLDAACLQLPSAPKPCERSERTRRPSKELLHDRLRAITVTTVTVIASGWLDASAKLFGARNGCAKVGQFVVAESFLTFAVTQPPLGCAGDHCGVGETYGVSNLRTKHGSENSATLSDDLYAEDINAVGKATISDFDQELNAAIEDKQAHTLLRASMDHSVELAGDTADLM
jgi:hypothetical protein